MMLIAVLLLFVIACAVAPDVMGAVTLCVAASCVLGMVGFVLLMVIV